MIYDQIATCNSSVAGGLFARHRLASVVERYQRAARQIDAQFTAALPDKPGPFADALIETLDRAMQEERATIRALVADLTGISADVLRGVLRPPLNASPPKPPPAGLATQPGCAANRGRLIRHRQRAGTRRRAICCFAVRGERPMRDLIPYAAGALFYAALALTGLFKFHWFHIAAIVAAVGLVRLTSGRV